MTRENLDTMEDAETLNDVISVCRDGERLYRYVAEQVEDQRLRNMFSDMAGVRLQILQELGSEVALRGAIPKKTGTIAGEISRWYVDARSRFINFSDREFIDQIEETEERTLRVLRRAVQAVEDRSLMFKLASLVATFQMSHDRMRAIQKSYR